MPRSTSSRDPREVLPPENTRLPDPPPVWLVLAGLHPDQQRLFQKYVKNCHQERAPPMLPEKTCAALNESQQTTFAAITQALKNTDLPDAQGRSLGNALELVEEVTDIHGENGLLASDQQFQIYVELAPDALEKLKGSTQFVRRRNTIFHRGFPISFRQPRRKGARGAEGGLHISVSPEGHRAVIHVDYRFGVFHLRPGNSDVRPKGNYRKHIERWPGLRNWWVRRPRRSRYTEAVMPVS